MSSKMGLWWLVWPSASMQPTGEIRLVNVLANTCDHWTLSYFASYLLHYKDMELWIEWAMCRWLKNSQPSDHQSNIRAQDPPLHVPNPTTMLSSPSLQYQHVLIKSSSTFKSLRLALWRPRMYSMILAHAALKKHPKSLWLKRRLSVELTLKLYL